MSVLPSVQYAGTWGVKLTLTFDDSLMTVSARMSEQLYLFVQRRSMRYSIVNLQPAGRTDNGVASGDDARPGSVVAPETPCGPVLPLETCPDEALMPSHSCE